MAGLRLPIAREGAWFIGAPLAGALALGLAGWVGFAVPLAVVGLCMVVFFRDPERTSPASPGTVIAPADGKVVDVRAGVADPFVGPAWQVSIFLSPLDVHVNRAPVAGLVVGVEHRPGAFLAAYRPEASERNEQTRIELQGETARVVVRQVAGVLARRIVCRARPGDKLAAGERFGLIMFGSRTDVLMPSATRIAVKTGDRVWGGESVLGVLS